MYLITRGPEEGTYSISISEDDNTHGSTSNLFDPTSYLSKSFTNNHSHVEFPDLISLGITTHEDKPVRERTEPLVDTTEVPGEISLGNTFSFDSYIYLNESETKQANQYNSQHSDPPVGLFIITDTEEKVFCLPNTDINVHSDLMGNAIILNESQNECVENVGLNEKESIETEKSTNTDIYPYVNSNFIEEYNNNSQNIFSEHSIRTEPQKLAELGKEKHEIADKLREIIAEVESKANEEVCLQELLESVEPFIAFENKDADDLDRNSNIAIPIAATVNDHTQNDPMVFTEKEPENSNLAISDVTRTEFINITMISEFTITNVVNSDFIAINNMGSSLVSDLTTTSVIKSTSDFISINNRDSTPISDFATTKAIDPATVSDFTAINDMALDPSSDSNAKDDSQNKLLFALIAEFTDEFESDDKSNSGGCNQDNQNSELSILVADTINKMETKGETGSVNKSIPSNPQNFSGIVAVDIGSTSIYLPSIDQKARILNKTVEKDRIEDKEKGIDEKGKFICHHCHSAWSDFYMIKSHIVWNHVPEIEKKQIYRIVPNMSNIKLINRIYNKFHALKKIRKRRKMKFSPYKFRVLFTKRKIKYYKCRECGFKTPKEYDMRKHKSMIHNKPLHKCTDCSYSTVTQSCLIRHVMAKHTKEKPHQCKFCYYSSTQLNTLQEHIMAKHTFTKLQECPYCDYSCVQRNQLKDHIKCKHTHEKNRKCHYLNCSYIGTSSATLRRHIMAKHTNERPYMCEYCTYSATQSGQLRKHIMAIHTKEKPFQCPHCSYEATQSYSLKIHIRRMHSIDKAFKCIECEYTCSTSTYLKYHMQKKHQEVSQKNSLLPHG